MFKFKTALNALSLTLLVTNFTIKGMEKPNFKATMNKAEEILKRPFYTMTLAPNAEIGYGDKRCIKNLNALNISTSADSPLVPVIFVPTEAQISSESNEAKNLFRSCNPLTKEELLIVEEYFNKFSKRRKELRQNAMNSSFPKPVLMPIQHLHSNTLFTLDPRVPVSFSSDELNKLEELKVTFREKPVASYFTISNRLVDELATIATNSPYFDYLKNAIKEEICDEITEQKQKFIAKNIVIRNPRQDNDLQSLADETLNGSTTIKHNCNYLSHGINGYSREKERHNILAQQFNGKNSVNAIHNNEMAINKRKLSQMTAKDLSDLNDRYKKFKHNSDNKNLS